MTMSDDESLTLTAITREAIEEINFKIENGEFDPSDRNDREQAIEDIAEESVPKMNAVMLQVAMNDLWLSVEEPDRPVGGATNAINFIGGNILEHVKKELEEEVRRNHDEEE